MQVKRNHEISVAIPSSLVAELPHLREKTSVLGQIGRASAIFRVNHIYIYKDSPNETKLIQEILQYMDAPQYLRKRLYPHKPELRYVGVLPPLRTPHHPLGKSLNLINVGDYREGYSLSMDGEVLADIGLNNLLKIHGPLPEIQSRAAVKITSVKPLEGKIVRKSEIEKYWGYDVHKINSLPQLLRKQIFDMTIGTSKNGAKLAANNKNLLKQWKSSEKILIAFGSPKKGLTEILGGKRGSSFFDFYLNMIPGQGTKTVRTSEAYIACLAIINLLS